MDGGGSGGEVNEEVGALAMTRWGNRNHIVISFGFSLESSW